MTLLASDKQKELSIVALCANPVNIGLNYFLIPWTQTQFDNGAIGSSIATVLTEALVMVAAFSLLPKGILRGFRATLPIKTVVAGIITGGAIALMYFFGFPWYISIALSPLIYFAILLVENTFEPEEIAFARGFLTRESLRRTFVPDRGVES